MNRKLKGKKEKKKKYQHLGEKYLCVRLLASLFSFFFFFVSPAFVSVLEVFFLLYPTKVK